MNKKAQKTYESIRSAAAEHLRKMGPRRGSRRRGMNSSNSDQELWFITEVQPHRSALRAWLQMLGGKRVDVWDSKRSASGASPALKQA